MIDNNKSGHENVSATTLDSLTQYIYNLKPLSYQMFLAVDYIDSL